MRPTNVKAKHGGGRKGKLSFGCFIFIDNQLEQISELTATQLRDKIFEHFGLNLEKTTVQRTKKIKKGIQRHKVLSNNQRELQSEAFEICFEMRKSN